MRPIYCRKFPYLKIPVPYVTSQKAGYDHSLQLPNYHRIASRIGLANSEKKVLRAGFGMLYNQAVAPGRIYNTPQFGRLANAGPARQAQFALKLLF